ncbi:hypothetical protein E4U42_006408 [Claviceps africana]|uniref:SCP domain-containing protein n=1 Tax=Claviceps africana TaxID=83212 RepID=A0A8K0JDV3_9HYPO|nr:hypothetical protein E4U42_006408 [Claviceps africana]
MKSSLLLIAASALLATATPVRKRAVVTDWVTQTEVVTVTDDCGLPTQPTPAHSEHKKKKHHGHHGHDDHHDAAPDAPLKLVNHVKPVAPPAITPPPRPAPVADLPKVEPPKVKAPEVKAPEVKAPEVKAPEVKAPEVKVPEVKAPEVKAPEVKYPEVKVPEVKYPEVKAPEVKVPEVKVKVPEVKYPEVKAPEVKAPATPNLSTYPKAVIDQHTLHRNNHTLKKPLEWSDELAQWALNTAKTCVFEHDMKQGTGNYGQNLASMGSTENIDGQEVRYIREAITNQWYNGEADIFNPFYGLTQPPSSVFMKIGHFTQLVWKGTQKVGCATVKCGAGTIFSMQSQFSVCNYWPPGNYDGEYNANVLPPIGLSPVAV